MSVVLYSTGCPKCKVLEKGLKTKGIDYTLINDEKEIIEHGFTTVPVLEIDNKPMHYPEAFNYLKQYKKGGASL